MRRSTFFYCRILSLLLLTHCVFSSAYAQQPETKKKPETPKKAGANAESTDQAEDQATNASGPKTNHIDLPATKQLPEEELSQIWTALTSGDWAEREAATRTLLKAGGSAKSLLVKALSHPDPEVRMRAAIVIRRTDETYIDALTKLAAHPMARRAYEILLELRHHKAVFHSAAMRKALDYTGATQTLTKESAIAIQLLSEFATPDDVEALVGLLNEDFQVSIDSSMSPVGINSIFYSVICALKKLPKSRTIPALRKLLAVEGAEMNAFPRVQALIALTYIGGPEVLPVLEEAITKRGTTVKIAALQCLEQVAEKPEDIDFLRGVITAEDEEVCVRCCRLFGLLRSKNGVPALKKALERDSEVIQTAALKALALIADPSSVDYIKLFAYPKLPTTPSERKTRLAEVATTRGMAFWALARMKKVDELTLQRLIEAGEDVEYMALLALAELNTDTAFNILRTQVLRVDRKAEVLELGGKAIRVMGKMRGNEKVYDFLSEIASDRRRMAFRSPAALALRDLGDEKAIERLIALAKLDSEQFKNMRAVVFRALGKLRPKSALPVLLRRFYEITKVDRSYASLDRDSSFQELIEALGNFGGKEVTRAFKSLEPKILIPDTRRSVKRPDYWKQPRSDGKRIRPSCMALYATIANACAHAGDNSMLEPLLIEFYNERDAELHNKTGRRRSGGSLNSLGIMLLYARKWDRADFTFKRQQWHDDRGRSLNVQIYNHACTNALRGKEDKAIADLYLAYYSNHSYWNSETHWRHFCTDLDLDSLSKTPAYLKMKRNLRTEYFLRSK